jgi:predicted tellurium resistance membrane protein TerC
MNPLSPEIWLSLLTLVILEIVLGIDNIIFISIITGKLPKIKQRKARNIGLSLAMVTRVLLLLSISWLMTLTTPLFNIAPLIGISSGEWLTKLAISGKDLILMCGGLFLMYKSIKEIHEKFQAEETHTNIKRSASFLMTIVQILILDIVFSLDSVITAIGMASHVEVMIMAVIIAVIIMLFASGAIANFVNKHASVKTLALAFLMLIGISLVAESLDQEIPKGYIYFGMAFSIVVEMLNIKEKKVKK